MDTRYRQLAVASAVFLLATFVSSCTSNQSSPPSSAVQASTGAETSAAARTSTSALTSSGSTLAYEESPAEHVLKAVYDSVVNITVTATVNGVTGSGIGSGIVYTADGYILTNDHVVTLDGAVSSGQTITVTLSSGETTPATLVDTDPTHDIAALKVPKTGLHPVTFPSANEVRLAQWAIVIGSPLDFRNSVTLGIISGLDRTLDMGPGQAPLTGLIQIDAPISPGNSGGGCFDTTGHLIGMPEVYLPPGSTGAENIGFAIPAGVVAEVAKKLTGK
ncbi:MAG: S1C family serine protease [Thermoleophilia bacterium]|nr:S1C family serine protease [Thermoleophilia bacterium]